MNINSLVLIIWKSQDLFMSKICKPEQIPGKETKITSESWTCDEKRFYSDSTDPHPLRGQL